MEGAIESPWEILLRRVNELNKKHRINLIDVKGVYNTTTGCMETQEVNFNDTSPITEQESAVMR
jgi:hypothetical protein